jgi:hypothetical protein
MSSPVTSGSYARDPVSELLDGGARAILDRAYAHPGHWQATRLADPTPAHVAHFAAGGINVFGPDNAPRRGGRGLDAHTRWCRGFVRAVYYQHLWYSQVGGRGWRRARRTTPRTAGAIKIEVGRRMPALGVIPAGRMVRVILYPGGRAALKAAAGEPEARRIFCATGEPNGGAAADATRRDW